jgi:YVTN family beta-propeller protein
MKRCSITLVLLLASTIVGVRYAGAGQAPAAASDPDIPINHRDRVYTADQFSNTISVTDPVDNKLIGSIHLGDPPGSSPVGVARSARGSASKRIECPFCPREGANGNVLRKNEAVRRRRYPIDASGARSPG